MERGRREGGRKHGVHRIFGVPRKTLFSLNIGNISREGTGSHLIGAKATMVHQRWSSTKFNRLTTDKDENCIRDSACVTATHLRQRHYHVTAQVHSCALLCEIFISACSCSSYSLKSSRVSTLSSFRGAHADNTTATMLRAMPQSMRSEAKSSSQDPPSCRPMALVRIRSILFKLFAEATTRVFPRSALCQLN